MMMAKNKSVKDIFKKTLPFIEARLKIINGFQKLSENELDKRIEIFEKETKDYLNDPLINNALKLSLNKTFSKWKKNSKEFHKGITRTKLSELNKKLRLELKNRIKNSMSLIKLENDNIKNDMVRRFLNYTQIDTPEIRGENPSVRNFINFIDFLREKGISERHAKFILKDQTHKLSSNLDEITAKNLGAIGGYWKNRKDIRVVGNPSGLYPKGNKMHEDHWDRENKFYILDYSKKYKDGYVKGEIYQNLEDGGLNAIGCRCRMQYVYYLSDIPRENLTKKGLSLVDK